MSYDLALRGGWIVTPEKVERADLAIADGVIASIGANVRDSAQQEIDATDLHIFPGIIDPHVHFNEPGRAHWEGFETGSRALAAGGGTLFFDMPLNSIPPTVDPDSFDKKVAAAKGKALVDFCLWGGLIPGNLDQLEPLSERGVIGFKAFMVDSGVAEFPFVNHKVLREGMKRAAKLDQIVAVHAEWPALIRRPLLHSATIRDFLDSRPIQAEHEAIRVALELAGETSCALHIVHVSAGSSIELILHAQKQGVNASCETCPHYLVFSEKDMEKLGAVAKCAPPLRPGSEQDQLWGHVRKGAINFVASDHSPSPWELKAKPDFFQAWGGISSCQHAFPLIVSEGHHRRNLPLEQISKLCSTNVADRFGLNPQKGRISVGADADLTLLRVEQTQTVAKDQLLYRHPHTPYIGRTIRGTVVRTIVRGQTVYCGGKIVSQPIGRFVKPSRNRS